MHQKRLESGPFSDVQGSLQHSSRPLAGYRRGSGEEKWKRRGCGMKRKRRKLGVNYAGNFFLIL